MKKITSIFLVAILYGCGSSVSPVDQGLIDQVMHIGNGSEPQGLDPHVVTGVPEHHLLITMCEGLTISNPEGGANLPGMAESWDCLLYTSPSPRDGLLSRMPSSA